MKDHEVTRSNLCNTAYQYALDPRTLNPKAQILDPTKP